MYDYRRGPTLIQIKWKGAPSFSLISIQFQYVHFFLALRTCCQRGLYTYQMKSTLQESGVRMCFSTNIPVAILIQLKWKDPILSLISIQFHYWDDWNSFKNLKFFRRACVPHHKQGFVHITWKQWRHQDFKSGRTNGKQEKMFPGGGTFRALREIEGECNSEGRRLRHRIVLNFFPLCIFHS